MKVNLKRIFLIAGGALILLAVILLILTRKPPEPEEILPTTEIQEEQQPKLPPVSQEERDKSNLLITAANFTERFGSYSNQGNFENIEDLYPFMTQSLKSWSDGYIEKQIAELPDFSSYYGMTTKALSYDFLIFDDSAGYAKVKVSTQRIESSNSMENGIIFYQDAEIEFAKIAGAWKVDGIWWK